MRKPMKYRYWFGFLAIALTISAYCIFSGMSHRKLKHPTELGQGMTEKEFRWLSAVLEKLLMGNRASPTGYAVKWADDDHWCLVRFDTDGKAKGLSYRYEHKPTGWERLLELAGVR